MTRTLQEELRQTRPFQGPEHEAALNIVRTAAVVNDALELLLKPHGVTLPQYNVLRILRGAGAEGLCRNEVRDRMLTRMPDMTRLLDRMEEAGLVTRERSTTDRRLVSTRITAEGLRIVNALDAPLAEEHARLLGHLGAERLRQLSELLTLARNPD